MPPLLSDTRTTTGESELQKWPARLAGLADIQLSIRQTIVSGDDVRIAPILTGGKDPAKRLQVHRRHYEMTLVTALVERFPATAWLIGSALVTETARRYICEHPPSGPCIAEYGATFSEFLAVCVGGRLPYVSDFAELEWHLGHVSIATDCRSVPDDVLSRIPAGQLPDIVLGWQTGVRYLQFSWPVDELMRLYLTDTAPESLRLLPEDIWIELRGARGEFHLNRLTRGDFMFRRSIAAGYSLGDAAEAALDVDDKFDPARALHAVLAEGLIVAVKTQRSAQ